MGGPWRRTSTPNATSSPPRTRRRSQSSLRSGAVLAGVAAIADRRDALRNGEADQAPGVTIRAPGAVKRPRSRFRRPHEEEVMRAHASGRLLVSIGLALAAM